MPNQMTINYPESFRNAVGISKEQFEIEAKWAMAVKLYEMKRLYKWNGGGLLRN